MTIFLILIFKFNYDFVVPLFNDVVIININIVTHKLNSLNGVNNIITLSNSIISSLPINNNRVVFITDLPAFAIATVTMNNNIALYNKNIFFAFYLYRKSCVDYSVIKTNVLFDLSKKSSIELQSIGFIPADPRIIELIAVEYGEKSTKLVLKFIIDYGAYLGPGVLF